MEKKLPCVLAAAAAVVLGEFCAGAADCIAPPPGLIGWWRGQGNAFDSAGIYDGEVVGGPGFAEGFVGAAFRFSGEGDDYVRLPENTFPMPNTGDGSTPFSLELWFKTLAGGVILGQQDAKPFTGFSGYVPAIYVGTNGLLHVSMFWGPGPQLIGDRPVNDGLFHHLAVTYDGATQRVYLDGAQAASGPLLQDSYAATYFYQLGTGFTGGWPNTDGGWFPFTGLLDEVSLYDRPLTESEVLAIYSSGNAGKCGGPVLRHRYSFNGTPGTTAILDSVRGANGALAFASTNWPFTNGVADGSALTGSGQLRLSGQAGFVTLPAGLVSALSNLTIEAWLTWQGPSTSGWQRVFDFGSSDLGTGLSRQGTNYLMLSPMRADKYVCGFQATTLNPLAGPPDPEGATIYGKAAFPLGQAVHVAVTYDPGTSRSELFVNGAVVGTVAGQRLNPLNKFADRFNWLGRSQWAPDPLLNGWLDEFRIWDGILTPDQIATHAAGGPNGNIGESRPSLSVRRLGQGIAIGWAARSASEFTLYTTSSAEQPDWQPAQATVSFADGRCEAIVPALNRAFYRLVKQ